VPQDNGSMTREQFLIQTDKIHGLRRGTLKGNEKLECSGTVGILLHSCSLIALADSSNNIPSFPDQVVGCSTIADLLRLAPVEEN